MLPFDESAENTVLKAKTSIGVLVSRKPPAVRDWFGQLVRAASSRCAARCRGVAKAHAAVCSGQGLDREARLLGEWVEIRSREAP